MDAYWGSLWPEIVSKRNHIPPRDKEFSQIINITNSLREGFENLNGNDIEELFIEDKISEKDPLNMVNYVEIQSKSISESDTEKPNLFTLQI